MRWFGLWNNIDCVQISNKWKHLALSCKILVSVLSAELILTLLIVQFHAPLHRITLPLPQHSGPYPEFQILFPCRQVSNTQLNVEFPTLTPPTPQSPTASFPPNPPPLLTHSFLSTAESSSGSSLLQTTGISNISRFLTTAFEIFQKIKWRTKHPAKPNLGLTACLSGMCILHLPLPAWVT